MTDIITFLRARYDEEERDLMAISHHGYEPQQWEPEDGQAVMWMPIHAVERQIGAPLDHAEKAPNPFALVSGARGEWWHVMRWDPERVQVEINAKRIILTWHDEDQKCTRCVRDFSDGDFWPCEAVKAMAVPYQDHTDHDPAWGRL